ncbi:MAG TPA: phosphoribosyltransferase family protein [Candidatus Angelobacter sp.]|nr:phosphoribosyltransferase family protein [Candidatus Angelobacter sp.]
MPDLLTLVGSRTGHFRLESGHHTDRWLELDQLFVRPAVLRPFASELAGRVASHGVDIVCGPLSGGAFLAELMALELGVEFVFAERIVRQRAGLFPVDYRIPLALRAALHGKRVAIVDDAISMGSAVGATIADLETCQATVVVVGALIVMGPAGPEFAAARGLPLERLTDLPLHTWLPGACQLCTSGSPVADP